MADETSNTSATEKNYEASFKLRVIEYAETNTNRGAAREFDIGEKLVSDWRLQKDELQKLAPDSTQEPEMPFRVRTPKRQYPPVFKLKVIQKAEESSNREAASEYNVDEKMVREWRKQKEKLESIPPQRQKAGNAGPRPQLPELEKTLVQWILAQPKRPTNVQIQEKALEIHDGKSDFKASRGWLDKFMHRHGLHARHTNPWPSVTVPTAAPIVTMDIDSVISQIIPGEGAAINLQECLEVANVEETATKRRKFEPAFKLKVIGHAEQTSNREAAREFNVDERMVRGWRSQKDHIQSLPQEVKETLPPTAEEQVPQVSTSPEQTQQGQTATVNAEASSQVNPASAGDVSIQQAEMSTSTPVSAQSVNVSQISTPGPSTSSTPKGLKRKYDVAFKLQVVEYAETTSNRGAGRHFNVDEKRVREWRKQKAQLSNLPPGKDRVGRAGCHPLLLDLEYELVAWIKNSPVRPTYTNIQDKALELYTGDKPFKASRGWLEKFLHRHDLYINKKPPLFELHQALPDELHVPTEPDAIEVTQEEINEVAGELDEVDIQACLNLAKTIQETMRQGGDESALTLARSIEESVKKSIAETLNKNEGTAGLNAEQMQNLTESLVESVQERVAQSLHAAQVQSIAESLAEAVKGGQMESITDSLAETVEESIAEVPTDIQLTIEEPSSIV